MMPDVKLKIQIGDVHVLTRISTIRRPISTFVGNFTGTDMSCGGVGVVRAINGIMYLIWEAFTS